MPEASGKIMKFVKISLAVVGGLFIILVIYRIPHVKEQQDAEETIRYIQAQRITMADVMGENLPPMPDPEENDATIAGIDTNNNNIRDDVELAIHERYPDDPVVRSAMLQYAQDLQLELTLVTNSETWVAAVQETNRGGSCLFATSPDVSIEEGNEAVAAAFAVGDGRIEEVENLVYNTTMREERRQEVAKLIASHGESEKPEDCDIDPEEFNET